MDEHDIPLNAVAVIGMAGRFPQAPTVQQFWQNLANSHEAITFLTDEELLQAGVDPQMINHPNYVKAGGFIDDEDKFPADFFGFTPREAEITAPQHRLFLKCAWETLESAGYVGEEYAGNIAVFGGMNFNNYLLNNIYSNSDIVNTMGNYQLSLANSNDFLCTRTSYKLNLHGPSVAVQTACSTALVAISLAHQSLINYQTDMALAGGVTLWSPQRIGYFYQPGSVLSPDGRGRTFDARSEGSVSGNGVGMVLLKRLDEALADRDHIYAVVLGTAINNDGSMKVGFTAPSVNAQTEVVLMAQAMADVDVETIGYIEAHGTGTRLGDPVEVKALTRAFRESTDKVGYCALSALKTSIGHLDAASGIAGFIKTTLSLYHGKIPASLNYETPNPEIDFDSSPFFVNTELRDWPTQSHPRRAGINSLGLGGTNAHAILEQAPHQPPLPISRPAYPLILSARLNEELERMIERLHAHCQEHPQKNLADAAYTLMIGRKAFNYRAAWVIDATQSVDAIPPQPFSQQEVTQHNPPITFLFNNSQPQLYSCQQLYDHHPTFRQALQTCSQILADDLGFELTDILYPQAAQQETAADLLTLPHISRLVNFCLGYSVAQCWLTWGIEPQLLVGQDVGEYVAACISGVFSLADALNLLLVQGEILQEITPQSVWRVSLPAAEVTAQLPDGSALLLSETESCSVVVGDPEEMADLLQKWVQQEVTVDELDWTDMSHSHLLPPTDPRWQQAVTNVDYNPPNIPFFSNMSGSWIMDDEAQSADYWEKHFYQPINLADSLVALADFEDWFMLEVTPGNTLTELLAQANDKLELLHTLPATPSPTAYAHFVQTWVKLWVNGVELDRQLFFGDEERYRQPLPTYPFTEERYWLEQQSFDEASAKTQNKDALDYTHIEAQYEPDDSNAPQGQTELMITDIWQSLLGVSSIRRHDNFFALGGTSLISLQIVGKINELGYAITPEDLLSNQTVATLAQQLGDKKSTPTSKPIKETSVSIDANLDDSFLYSRTAADAYTLLQTGTNPDTPPIFCIPPSNGNLFAYERLVRHLDHPEPTIYALNAVYDKVMECDNLIHLSEYYLSIIKEIQPTGPYYILGWSAGGPFAFEICYQLQQRGEEIALLAIVDSSMGKNSLVSVQLLQGLTDALPWAKKLANGNYIQKLLFISFIRFLLRFRYKFVQQQVKPFNRAALVGIYINWIEQNHQTSLAINEQKLVSLQSLEEQFDYVKAQTQAKGINIDVSMWRIMNNMVEMALHMSQLIDDYEPHYFSGRAYYYRAEEKNPGEQDFSLLLDPETRGCAPHIEDIIIYKIPGDHFSMMDAKNINYMADYLRYAIQNAPQNMAWEPDENQPLNQTNSVWGRLLLLLTMIMIIIVSLWWLGFIN